MIVSITDQFAECGNLLVAQREPLLRAISEARAAEAQAMELLKQLDRALAALEGEAPKATTKRRRGSDKSERKCSTKIEVLTLLAEASEEIPYATDAELRDAVQEKLRGRGRSLSMFAKLFADCLQERGVGKGAQAAADPLRPSVRPPVVTSTNLA